MTNQEATNESVPPEDPTDRLLQTCLDRLAAGDPDARNDLFAVVDRRLTQKARKMLARFPAVRQSNQTGDVVNEAVLKLLHSLNNIHPETPRRFLGLVGLEMRRVLIDLYRRCKGPESNEANRATNVFRGADGEVHYHSDQVAATGDDPDLDKFERLHKAAEQLDEADQELFHMKWFLKMTHPQIAAQIGCSEKTIDRKWGRVQDFLRQKVKGRSSL